MASTGQPHVKLTILITVLIHTILRVYYSFPNIDATNNGFRYSPKNGTARYSVSIPEGCYEIKDINEQVQRVMKESVHCNLVTDVHNIKIEAIARPTKAISYFL